eukprot:SAG22_NODE_2790_length_2209_cov_1.681043_2_plen_95_part_00
MCVNADIIVRGFEDTSADDVSLTLPSGLRLPRTARMTLHHFEDKVDGFAFAELAKVPAGYEGVLCEWLGIALAGLLFVGRRMLHQPSHGLTQWH